MPAIKIDDFKIPEEAKKKSPLAIIDATFQALTPWFAAIIPKIETEWQRGVAANDDRNGTQIRLGGLVGQASAMKDLLQAYVNKELSIVPPIAISDLKLPEEATTRKSFPAPEMIGKAFQALTPWFKAIIPKIKPYWENGVTDNDDRDATVVKLRGLVGQINVMKELLEKYVNKEIAKKERSSGFSAGGQDEVEIPEKVGLHFLVEFLDVEIGDNED